MVGKYLTIRDGSVEGGQRTWGVEVGAGEFLDHQVRLQVFVVLRKNSAM